MERNRTVFIQEPKTVFGRLILRIWKLLTVKHTFTVEHEGCCGPYPYDEIVYRKWYTKFRRYKYLIFSVYFKAKYTIKLYLDRFKPLDQLDKYLVPILARRVFPELFKMDTVGVIPMTEPTGLYFAMRYVMNKKESEVLELLGDNNDKK